MITSLDVLFLTNVKEGRLEGFVWLRTAMDSQSPVNLPVAWIAPAPKLPEDNA